MTSYMVPCYQMLRFDAQNAGKQVVLDAYVKLCEALREQLRHQLVTSSKNGTGIDNDEHVKPSQLQSVCSVTESKLIKDIP